MLSEKLKAITSAFSYKQKVAVVVILGVIVGLGALFMYLLRAHTYFIGDNPSACVNCHIMTPYYASWSHSSHGRIDDKSNGATCNDCHVPHQNLAAKYGFKALDGMKHTIYFVTNSERQAPMAETLTGKVVMDNCIRCHTQLNQEFVKTGRIDFMLAQKDEGKACWDCHRNVPHGGMNSLSSTPNAESQTPLPPSPVPEWLQKMMN
ncbi:MAG: cytochrome c nitrite reductase small subunit [Prevotella sp.]|nr:cytochrome c nitrite reductase small subunit [Prevotella sp.]